MALKEKFDDLGRLVLRVGVGANMALLHGFGKVGLFTGGDTSFADPLHMGPRLSLAGTATAEFICAILMALGIATRFNALVLTFTMSVAGFVVLGPDPWGKKELAVLYLAGALAVVMLGPGRISFDNFLWSRRKGGASAKARKPVPGVA